MLLKVHIVYEVDVTCSSFLFCPCLCILTLNLPHTPSFCYSKRDLNPRNTPPLSPPPPPPPPPPPRLPPRCVDLFSADRRPRRVFSSGSREEELHMLLPVLLAHAPRMRMREASAAPFRTRFTPSLLHVSATNAPMSLERYMGRPVSVVSTSSVGFDPLPCPGGFFFRSVSGRGSQPVAWRASPLLSFCVYVLYTESM